MILEDRNTYGFMHLTGKKHRFGFWR